MFSDKIHQFVDLSGGQAIGLTQNRWNLHACGLRKKFRRWCQRTDYFKV